MGSSLFTHRDPHRQVCNTELLTDPALPTALVSLDLAFLFQSPRDSRFREVAKEAEEKAKAAEKMQAISKGRAQRKHDKERKEAAAKARK